MSDILMPPKVTEAVAAVMKEVPKLAKGERNTHGNYNFASIDDFLEAVRPLMAKVGLVIASDEDDFEVIDKWLRMRFAFSVHCGGESAGPYRRSIMVLASMGAQAFGAGQSYAEKQFLRSLFKIATGEGSAIDADSHAQQPLERTQARMIDAPMNGPARSAPKRLAGIHKTVSALREGIRSFKSEIESCEDIDQFEACLLANVDLIDQVQKEKSDWWDGDGGNFAGLEANIAAERKRIEEKA